MEFQLHANILIRNYAGYYHAYGTWRVLSQEAYYRIFSGGKGCLRAINQLTKLLQNLQKELTKKGDQHGI